MREVEVRIRHVNDASGVHSILLALRERHLRRLVAARAGRQAGVFR